MSYFLFLHSQINALFIYVNYDNAVDVSQYICKVQMMMALNKRVLYRIVCYINCASSF